jgi:hypothetical protein
MPSTFSPNLRIELIGTGEQSGTWGSTTNTNLGTLIEEAISGYEPITITATPYALVATDGAADQARNAVLELNVGSPLATNFAVYAPPATKLYVIKNISGYTATIYVATSIGGTTAAPGSAFVVIPTGQTSFVLCDGVNAYDALNSVSQNFRVGNNLTVSNDLTVVETATSKNITVNEKLLPPAYATAFPSSTLASALAAGASSLTLVDGTAFSSSGTIQIDSERITYSGKTTNTLTGLSRAQGGTSDVAHAASAVVTEIPAASLANLVTNGNISWNSSTDTGVVGTGSLLRFLVDTISAQALTNKTLLGAYINGQYKSNAVAVPALNVDCSLGNYFTKSISTNSTFTISNVPSEVYSLTVQLTTSSGALPTWWANTYWPENAPPNISNGVHLFMFVTSNGGSTWRGSALINYTN